MISLKKSFLSGLVFSSTVLCSFYVYAWTNILTKTDGQAVNAVSWNELVNNINTIGSTYAPHGAIMAFYLSSCPTGWIAADGNNGTPDLRGEFIRGWNYNNGTNKNTNTIVDSGRTLGGWQESTGLRVTAMHGAGDEQSVNGASIGLPFSFADSAGTTTPSDARIPGPPYNTLPAAASDNYIYGTSVATASINYNNWITFRSRNVALLYCMKL